MTDFLFSSDRLPSGRLAQALQPLHLEDAVPVSEFHGDWGALAVTPSRYSGFAPVETDTHLCVIIGGPVLYFRDNDFLAGGDRQAGTKAILAHWQGGEADWSEDLSGPFVILIIDKVSQRITCITDLMLFIPVYRYQQASWLCLGTHVDAVAGACGREADFDETSLVDFILHGAVTFPHTAYHLVQLCHPGTEHEFQLIGGQVHDFPHVPYWCPKEEPLFDDLASAAGALRVGVEGYVERVTSSMHRVAQFLSGGEDSRVVASMLPQRLARDAFVFLNGHTREERIAGKVAVASGANFRPQYRGPLHYLELMQEASRLVGSGHQYIHAHALGFHRQCDLSSYEAVFGGYLADCLIKSHHARPVPGSNFFVFLPQVDMGGETRTREVRSDLFPRSLLREVTQRRRAHFQEVSAIRPHSAHEWFRLWPMTMETAIPNLYSNRRLFRSYEMFTCKEAVKVSAATPIAWKLNRRLFLKAFRPYLKPTRFLFHTDGRLPYFPWWVNLPLRTSLWSARQLLRRTGLQTQYQGSWADWKSVIASQPWKRLCETTTPESMSLPSLRAALANEALAPGRLSVPQQVNLLQVCYLTSAACRWGAGEASRADTLLSR
ncbi:hypothetical protein [Halomonas stenophila]|uniref:asparagine synthase (glutamine-hydrolyzing) n=1 Tax=Halomonas stenophila TaxID=795312 RepID=A0A7W5HI64_9GAMM|nr:hypothetical protein [Halomonas stenophila]MBB3229585.1 hypothetical protein [Halomonas stenophila]